MVSRGLVVDAAERERRRIERDLHDGAQQRLIALTILLGRAQARLGEREPEVADLIAQARLNHALPQLNCVISPEDCIPCPHRSRPGRRAVCRGRALLGRRARVGLDQTVRGARCHHDH
ncbi:MAG: hypothetical protein IPP00_03360 [Actinomycetales bacterium]|uniref:Signal transduction histidine kinase subgroup 3 dimerisation and phosphoacceptor domain-containing protein n=1 Tax=Candidatus Phosphoribacter hodrii TaxID=2953743 RepID=A0A9D7TAT2_9MICO|nr:hypothetical protein [Candidatus Phosphoribacter hodrii]